MSALARWCARWRLIVIALWLAALVGLGGAVGVAGTAFHDEVGSSDSESSTAYALLAEAGLATRDGSEAGTVVWHTDGTPITDAAVIDAVEPVLARLAEQEGVTRVVSPYDTEGAGQLNEQAGIAYASVSLTDAADPAQMTDIARSIDSESLEVVTGGRAFAEQPAAGGTAEILGVIAALAILLLVFRSWWAAVLPIVTGVVGVGVSALTVLLASNVIDVPSQTIAMGSLIGLGVGIDYALFIVNRHRKGLMSGMPLRTSIAQAVNTSGRAVVFAGATVIVALLGMITLQVSLLTGMAVGAAVTVLITVIAALTLLPALLSVIGPRVLSRRQRRALAAGDHAAEPAGVWGSWATTVQRHPVALGGVAAVLILLIASPVLSMRLGSADASSDPTSSGTYRHTALMSQGFGDGYDAQLLLVAETPDDASRAAFGALAADLPSIEHVADVSAAPLAAGQQIGVITVTPDSSAQAEQTADLVHTLRDDVVPAAERGSSLHVSIGGNTASNLDFAESLTSKLPIYLAIVGVIGFLLLAIAFRSLLVPLIGALTNLLSIGAGLGAVTAIFQFGWGSRIFGVGSAAPIEPFVSVMIVGIVFGLAMDYQTFLVSRMHEEWTHTGDNRRTIRVGMSETGRVIATAAAIMFCVFGSFGLAGERVISELGVGMGVAVLVDALLVRLVLVPAVMHRIGNANWWYPRWAERVTPQLSIEGDTPSAPIEIPLQAGATAQPVSAATQR